MKSNASHTPMEALRLFSWLLLASSLLLIGGGYFWRGIDFSLGVLLGSAIVGLNYLWTRRVISKALQGDHPRSRIGFSLLFKFGLTALVLYFAVVQFGIDAMGIVVGVSVLVISVFALAIAKLAF